MDLASFLNAKQIKDLARIISEAELLTSGEIRLHLEEKCEIETEARALEVFYSLNMGNTKLKNAVLLYISYGDQKFAICGVPYFCSLEITGDIMGRPQNLKTSFTCFGTSSVISK